MGSQRLKQHSWGLHGSASGPLSIYFVCQLDLFVELLIEGACGSLTLLPALGTHFLLLGCFVQPHSQGVCLTLMDFVLFLSLGGLLLFEERFLESGCWGERKCEGNWEEQRKKKLQSALLYRRRINFQLKGGGKQTFLHIIHFINSTQRPLRQN